MHSDNYCKDIVIHGVVMPDDNNLHKIMPENASPLRLYHRAECEKGNEPVKVLRHQFNYHRTNVMLRG